MKRRQYVSAQSVLGTAGFTACRYESKVDAIKYSTGRTTYRKDQTGIIAVVNHNLPSFVFVYNDEQPTERKLWNLNRPGECDLFLRLLDRVLLNPPRQQVYTYSLDGGQPAKPSASDSTYVELTHDEFENIRAAAVCTPKVVLTILQELHMNPAAYDLGKINARLYDSGLDKCGGCHDWTEEGDLSITWLCPSCTEKQAKQLAIQVHC